MSLNNVLAKAANSCFFKGCEHVQTSILRLFKMQVTFWIRKTFRRSEFTQSQQYFEIMKNLDVKNIQF